MEFIQFMRDGRAEVKTEYSTLLVTSHCECDVLYVQQIHVLINDGLEVPVDISSESLDFDGLYQCINDHIQSEVDDALLAQAGV